MKNLTQLATENATKKTWIKNGIKNFMDVWGYATSECEEIQADTKAYEDHNGQSFTLYTGCTELKSWDEYKDDIDKDSHFTSVLPTADLRHIANILPQLIAEIETKLDKNTKQNEKLSEKLNKMADLIK